MKRDGRVLVVEESPFVSRAIEAAGDDLQVSCDRASDGWEAIEMLETGQYEAIVIDSDIPRHSGYGVLAYLHEEIGDTLDNVIVMTSSDRDEVRRKISVGIPVVSKDDAVRELTRVMTSRH